MIAVERSKPRLRRRTWSPIGLDIGAVTPQEIAVAIVAELIAVRLGRREKVAAASLRWMPKVRAPQRA